MKKLLIISLFLFSVSAQAEFNERLYKQRTIGADLEVRNGKGPTPINTFDPINTIELQKSKEINLDKYFNYPENMSAVVMHNSKIVYERYNEEKKFNEKFLAHGMSMTKTAVGLAIGHLFCEAQIKSLDDNLGMYSKTLSGSIYKNISIRNVLRMASGINEDRIMENIYNRALRNKNSTIKNDQHEIIKAITKNYSDQGKDSRYHTLDVTAAVVLVTDITGKSLDQVFFDKIFSKINPEGKMIWWADKNGNALGMAGLNLTTRDWARLGQYMVNEMRSDSCIGKYLKDGLKQSIKTTLRKNQKYGYFFWVSKINNKPVIVLTGMGGQIMIPNHYNNSVSVVISASNFKYGKYKIIEDIMLKVSEKF